MCSVQAIIDWERITDDFHYMVVDGKEVGGCFCLMSGMF